VIPGETAAKAAPDGYTLLIASGALWIGPLIQSAPYDPVRDFSPVSLVGRSPLLLVVHPSLPVKSVRDLIALAKARPSELNYSSAGTGSTSHLAGELFKAMGKVDVVRVPYKGAATETADLIGGQVQLSFGTFTSVMPLVKAAKLRAIAVTGSEPSPLFPSLPTVAVSGVPGYEFLSIYGMFAPAKTPEAIIKRLNEEVAQYAKTTEAKQRFATLGIEAIGGSPEELAAAVKSDTSKMGKLIKEAGIRGD
jgi:tripartite-type tricarboxylate transporter receptor subunit TctC